VLRLIERVDAELPTDSPTRADEDYQRILRHRRIDSVKVIEARLGHDLTNASDFSRLDSGPDSSWLRRRQAPRRGLARESHAATTPATGSPASASHP
jgi:hypothetical protein